MRVTSSPKPLIILTFDYYIIIIRKIDNCNKIKDLTAGVTLGNRWLSGKRGGGSRYVRTGSKLKRDDH